MDLPQSWAFAAIAGGKLRREATLPSIKKVAPGVKRCPSVCQEIFRLVVSNIFYFP